MDEYKVVLIRGRKTRVYPKECTNCKSIYYVPKHAFDKSKFCSRECKNSYGRVDLICDFCGNTYSRTRARSKANLAKSKSGLTFCSRQCKQSASKSGSGEKFDALRPERYGRDYRKYNYREIAFEMLDEIACQRCGYNEFTDILDVHHIDENRMNNDPSNLIVLCPTCHRVEHYFKGTGWYKYKKKKYPPVT